MESLRKREKVLRIGEEGKEKIAVGWKCRLIVVSFVMATQAFQIYFSLFQALELIRKYFK